MPKSSSFIGKKNYCGSNVLVKVVVLQQSLNNFHLSITYNA